MWIKKVKIHHQFSIYIVLISLLMYCFPFTESLAFFLMSVGCFLLVLRASYSYHFSLTFLVVCIYFFIRSQNIEGIYLSFRVCLCFFLFCFNFVKTTKNPINTLFFCSLT